MFSASVHGATDEGFEIGRAQGIAAIPTAVFKFFGVGGKGPVFGGGRVSRSSWKRIAFVCRVYMGMGQIRNGARNVG